MQRSSTYAFAVLGLFASSHVFAQAGNNTATFTENKGQLIDQNRNPRTDILYSGVSSGFTYFLNHEGISYQLYKSQEAELSGDHSVESKKTVDVYRVDLSWPGANPDAKIIRGNVTGSVSNYYSELYSSGLTGVKSYEHVTYKGLYKGIDLKYYSRHGSLKYDYIVEPGADYRNIRIKIDGAGPLKLNPDGSVTLHTPLGDINEGSPVVMQEGKIIRSSWVIANKVLSFNIPVYDRSKPLIIDPMVLGWGTYYGGAAGDHGYDVSTDGDGNVYMCGSTSSSNNIATTGAFQTTISNTDGYLVKFDAAGARLWATYYGGASSDFARSCGTDDDGNVYLLGGTSSASGISTPGAWQSTLGGTSYDAMLIKFDADGIREWGTYYGGNGDEYVRACEVSGDGNVYITGYTNSATNIAGSGAFQTALSGAADGFIAMFNDAGTRQWSTYFGGTNEDRLTGCAIASNGAVYVCGDTWSSGLASTGAFLVTNPATTSTNRASILASFDNTGARNWSTYYGSAFNRANSCAVDGSDNVYMTGYTYAPTVPGSMTTTGAHQAVAGGLTDGYLVKFNASGARQWSTLYGGNSADDIRGCAVDNNDHVYVTGSTASTNNIATTGAFMTTCGCGMTYAEKTFIAEFDASGNRLYGTYYGSADFYETLGYACAIGINGDLYITGSTDNSSGYSTPGSHQPNRDGGYDAFLIQFSTCSSPAPLMNPDVTTEICAGDSLEYSTSTVSGASYQWYRNGTAISGATNNTFKAYETGSYAVKVTSGGCPGLSAVDSLIVNPNPVASPNGGAIYCYGTSTGVVAMYVNSGTPPYSYAWTGYPGAGQVLNNVPAGIYPCTVTDANGCADTDTGLAYHALPPITVAASQTDVACNGGDDGSVSVIISGGNPPYDKVWSAGGMGNSISNLMAGSYTLTIEDGEGCIVIDTFEITEPSPIVTTVTTEPNTCYGDSTGKAFITVTGGTTPYTYEWINSGSTTVGLDDSITQQMAGLYEVIITDANQCIAEDTFSIAEPSQTLVAICAVTVDSTSGKNLVIWEKTGIERAMEYKVYRESNVGGQFNLLATYAPDDFSTYLDTASTPAQQSYLYKMSVVDSCGNESPLSSHHKTIHLTSNVGINNEVNLIWNLYEGKPYSTHDIMRSVNGAPFSSIAQVSSSVSSYTDLNPPAGQKTYRIDIDMGTQCDPSAKTTAYTSVSSNVISVISVGIPGMPDQPAAVIVPNPTTGLCSIVGSHPAKLRVTDVLGKTIIESRNTSAFDLSQVAAGMYMVELYNEQGVIYHCQKVVKQ